MVKYANAALTGLLLLTTGLVEGAAEKVCRARTKTESSSVASQETSTHGLAVQTTESVGSSSSSASLSGSDATRTDAVSTITQSLTSSTSDNAPATTSLVDDGGNAAGPYAIKETYQPDNFFDMFDFMDIEDPTAGLVDYVDRTTAMGEQYNLTSCSKDSCTLKVDVTETFQKEEIDGGAKRKSVRIQSKTAHESGLFILDVNHVPTGCGTWPAFWMLGSGVWPAGGEVDIFESIHDSPNNMHVMHTTEGCSVEQTDEFTGQLQRNSCLSGKEGESGCKITSSKPAAGFDGVLATEWTDSHLKIWQFNRADVPADVDQGSPDPQKWPKPDGMYTNKNCDFNQHLKQMKFIINITLCGNWAGNVGTPGCTATCSSYVEKGSNFDQAYWDINYLKIYSQNQ